MKIIRNKKNKRSKKGQELIEAVIVIPFFFLILAFILNITQILINTYMIKEAVYSGARSAIVCTNLEDANRIATANAKKMLKNGISIKKEGLEITGVAEGGWRKNNVYHFKVKGTVELLFPWVDGDFKMTKNQKIAQDIYIMIENE